MKTKTLNSLHFNCFAVLAWEKDRKVCVKYFHLPKNSGYSFTEIEDEDEDDSYKEAINELSRKATDFCKENDLILWSY